MKVSFIVLFSIATVLSGCGSSPNAAFDEKPAAKSEDKKDSNEVTLAVSEQKGVIETETLQVMNQPEIVRASGKIALPDDKVWRVGVLAIGRVEKVYAKLGDYVKEGQILARMQSHEIHGARAEYLTAKAGLSRAQANAATAQKNLERAERLYSMKAGSLSDVERARQDLTNAETAVRDQQIAMERERIHLEDYDLDPDADPRNEEASLIPIKASGAGFILEKNVTPGAVIDPDHDAFVIGNLSNVWMLASVEEIDVARVAPGLPAVVLARSFPNDSFSGKITNLEAKIDPATRTMRVRIELANPAAKLRPEMLATAEIQTHDSKVALTIPNEGIQQINDQDVVFVKKSDDRFEARTVRIGGVYNGRITILEGVKPGETVVTKGTFLLKSQLLKASLSEG
jgi:cobalt-zinc-cadmium efflux system membrane fusion protein